LVIDGYKEILYTLNEKGIDNEKKEYYESKYKGIKSKLDKL